MIQTHETPFKMSCETTPAPDNSSRIRAHWLLVHEYYKLPGGEDELFHAARDLLRAKGHQVSEYVRRNDEIDDYGLFSKLSLGLRTTWSWDSHRRFRETLCELNPEMALFFNTFPLISPAVYYACRDAGVPVIQSLDNPRLICPAATLSRDSVPCQDCFGKTIAWPGLMHSCYHDSRLQTAAVIAMLAFHRWRKTWSKQVDCYTVATHFYRCKFIEAGLPAEKVFVKRHWIEPDPGCGTCNGDYALFIGRLAPEKGVPTVIGAWKQLDHVPLKIRGGGPLLPEIEKFVAEHSRVNLVPLLSVEDKFRLLKDARFLIWPSLGYYETFGLVAAEAFACGVPVIASRTGVAEEIVADGRTGLHFAPGDSEDLAAKVDWAWHHPGQMQEMGLAARAEYEAKYTAAHGYQRLMEIYFSMRASALQ